VAPPEAGFAVAELERALSGVGAQRGAGGVQIVLRQGAAQDVGYSLEVAKSGVALTARKPAGFLYGAATIRQLLAGRPVLPNCHIADWPAFAWRGFMHDVGRNFQEIALLERFVDVMAQYKMNIFHFHLSDDPGYRAECRVHPELNSPVSYLPSRHPGRFYSYAEINGLMEYCRERNIMLVPEIDMPGHSDYFKRAFRFDMQDERGMKIVEDVLNEFMDKVNTPFLHLGSDEVL
jgi:N-acetyl-beta-hexosaminidase